MAHEKKQARTRTLQVRKARAQARRGPAQDNARLRSVFRAAPVGIGLVSQRVLFEANDRLCEMTGYARDELIGQNARLLYPTDEDYEYVGREKYGQIRRNGTDTVETRWRRRDGRVIHVLLSSTPVNPNDLSQGVTFTALDITAQKESRARLRESEQRYRHIFERAVLGMYRTTPDGTILAANPALVRMLGYGSFDALARRNLEEEGYQPSYPRSAFKERIEAEGEIVGFESAWTKRDGTILFVRENAWLVRDASGRILFYEGTVEDITARKRAEEALRESEETFRSIIEASPMGIHVYELHDDNRLVFVGANPAADRLLGVDNSQFIGKTIEEAFPPLAETEIPDRYRRAARHGESWATEQVSYDYASISGAFEVHAFRMSPGKMAVLFNDVTERRRAEKERLDYERKLRFLASELSLAEERERRRLAAGLHDETCQTLVLSNMKLQELRRSLSGDEARPLADICEKLTSTVQSIRELTFDLSSPTLYKFGLEAALGELMEDKLRGEHGIRCRCRDDGAHKPLAEDVRILLYQSVRELLINVIKHAHADEVSLDTRRDGDSIRVTITDNGVGFEVDAALASPARNRGFGLFNIKERLDYIGGNIDIDSQPGHGCRFTLVAPLETTTAVAKDRPDVSQDPIG